MVTSTIDLARPASVRPFGRAARLFERNVVVYRSAWFVLVSGFLEPLFYLVAMGLCYLLLPGINEVPQQGLPGLVGAVTDAGVTFPPSVLWNFRIASVGVQAVTWATIALAFGPLAERLLESHSRRPLSVGRS